MKNRHALSLLLTANIVSGFAQGISMLAIPWYFVSILKQPSVFGMVYMLVTVVSLFWSLYAGALIDRYSRKRIFLVISVTGGIILSIVSALGYYLSYIPSALIIAVFASTIFNYNIHYPTLYAFGQEITEKKNYGKVSSYIEIQGQATTIISGAFAALLLQGVEQEFIHIAGIQIHLPFVIHRWELYEIFLMDAVTYFVAALLILFIRYIPQHQYSAQTGKVWERIKTGYRFLKKNPLLFTFGNASFAVFVVLLIAVQQLLPVYVNNHLQERADVYAFAEVIYAIGALSAGIGIRWIFRNTNTVLSIIIMMLVSVLIYYMCAFTRSTAIFYTFSFLIGITNAGIRVLRVTYLYHHVPNVIMGRVNSVFTMVNILLRIVFIGLFSLVFFSEGSNIRWAYFISGTFILLSVYPLAGKYKRLINLKILGAETR